MAYNSYGRNPYGMHPGYNPYPGAGRGMGHPGYGPPPGMSSAPGMAPPPGVQQPPSATQANRPSGLPPSFQPPPNLPNINFNAPVIRLGGTIGGSSSANGSSSGGAPPSTPSSWREAPDGPLSMPGRGPPGMGGPGLGAPGMGGIPMRPDFGPSFRHDRGGLGMDHLGGGNGRGGLGVSVPGAPGGPTSAVAGIRDATPMSAPSNDDKLRTIFIHKVPPSLSSGPALEQLLTLVGRLRRWDSETSHISDNKGEMFGFAQYEDAYSLSSAIDLLKSIKVPLKKQEPKDAATANGTEKDDLEMKDVKDEAGEKKEKPKSESGSESGDKKDKDEEEEDEEVDRYKGIEKTRLQIVVDPVSLEYIQLFKDCQSEEANAEEETRRAARKEALDAAVHDLFYPPASVTETADGDAKMADAGALAGEGVEVVNIPIAQEDELADIPAEMREIVASEIASFRERSNRRDAERLKREQELEEQELRRNGEASDRSRAANGSKSSAALPRGAEAAKNVDFVNGGSSANGHGHGRRREFEREDSVDTDASDEELYEREIRQRLADEDAQFKEAERKWTMRERQRAAALEREKERDRTEAERTERHQNEQLERDQTWDDEREASRKSTLYYRDRAAWLRKRGHDRAEEELRDTSDRRAERDQQRREAAEMETAKGMADSFLDQQAEGMMDERVRRGEGEEGKGGRTGKDGHLATGAAPQKVTISFGAAAQRAQAQRGGAMRRTVAEVEGLLDDEEQEASTKKRQLVPINFEPMAASASMTDEEINQAVRALAQEIPTERDGLWAWTVQWDSLDESVIRDKLRPFVEKKVVEYLGVQEQFLVEVVEEHLRKHGKPEALVEELQEALDEAEDLVKKLWRMVIFFSESEKRGLPA